MKKVIFFAILILNSQFSILNSLNAQGFEWVRTYTGADISSGVAANKLVGSCVDSAGNLYILGEFSPQAQLCGERLLPLEVITTPNNSAVLIAKLSPSGELLWHKAIYNGKVSDYAYALRMMGDSCIMAMVMLYTPYDVGGYNEYRNLYYLDTLLTGNSDYLIPNNDSVSRQVNAFITFDFDGNVTEQHFVRVGFTDTLGNDLTPRFMGNSHLVNLSTSLLSGESFNIDSEGNIYVIRSVHADEKRGRCDTCPGRSRYWRLWEGTIGAMKIVVDSTHVLTYPIPYPTARWNRQILKFSPHFDSLLDAVYVFDSALYFQSHPTFEIYAFNIDNHNNLFMNMTGLNVPAGIRMTNSDSLNLGDTTVGVCFTLRYNPDLYATGLIKLSYFGNCPNFPQINICDNCIDDTNFVFVAGYTDWFNSNTVEGIMYRNDTLDIPNKSGFWLQLNKNDLSLVSCRLVPPGDEGRVTYPLMTISKNRIFSQISFTWSMAFNDTVIYANHYADNEKAFSIWDYEGNNLLFKQYNVGAIGNLIHCPNVIDSIVYVTGSIHEDATFGDIETHNQGHSQVYIAKYVDPEFARPYVHPSDRHEQSIEWQQELTLSLADSPVLLTATATSGLPVTYTCSDSIVAYTDSNMLYLLRNGTATLTATQPGDYYYFPAEPVTKTLRVSNTGIHDLQLSTLNSQISIYPNPAKDVVYLNPNGTDITAVRLFSSHGRQEQATLSNNRIDISHLPAGVYYLTVVTATNRYQYKIVKP